MTERPITERRLIGWGARLLRLVGVIGEGLAWLAVAFGFSSGEAVTPYNLLRETRRGVGKAMRGWWRSTVICTPMLTPLALALQPLSDPHWMAIVIAAVLTAGAIAALSAPIAFIVVLLGRALRAPRPLYDITCTSLATGIAADVLLRVAAHPAPWLWVWPYAVGALWGWLYWFYARRPRFPYAPDHS